MSKSAIISNLLAMPVFLLGLVTEVAIADPNLVAYWKFDEGGGSVAYDSSGNNHGTIYGAIWTSGQNSGALSFDGVNDYVEVSDDPSLDITNEITIGAWVKISNLDTEYFIVSKQPSTCERITPFDLPGNYEFSVMPFHGYLRLRHQHRIGINNANISTYTSTSGITPGVWHHVVVSLVEGGNVNFMIDGSPVGILRQFGRFYSINNEPIRIGTRKDNYSYFNGIIDDIFVYDRALSGNEIRKRLGYTCYMTAWNPYPPDGHKGVTTNRVLSWWPGELAASHDVYFGTDETAVANADTNTTDIYRGRQNLDKTTYDLTKEPLEFDKTYYWRIDEVNGPSMWKGNVWRFTWRTFAAADDTVIRILSWNIEFLGIRNPPRTQEQIDAIARRILTFDASVLALQEIYDASVLEYIRSQMGASWKIYYSKSENALLYDESKVEMITGERLTYLDNYPYSHYPGAKHSRPVSGIFRPVGMCAKPLHVIGVHCHWDNVNTRISEGTWLNTKIIEFLNTPGEPKDIILLGDLNGSPGSPPHTQLQEGGILHRIPKENEIYSPRNHCYVTQSVKDKLQKQSTFVIRAELYGENPYEFGRTYSDHYPIFIDFQPEIITCFVEDFETHNFSRFPWEHYGDKDWTITSRHKYSGTYSAQAGDIDDDGYTTLQITIDCVSGNITFYRKVSSESGYDHLKFYIDGQEIGRWSGEEDWDEVSFPVEAGIRTFRWTYSKDGSVSAGEDTAWIDDIVFPIE